jgi:hypothetical protein
MDASIMLGRKGCRGITVAGNNRVIIIVIIIVFQDLEGVVVSCQTLVHSGIVMVFDVVATLGGAATATLGGGAVSTLGDVGRGNGELDWPDIIVVS